MKVWIDGNIVDGDAAKLPVTDHGLLYGDGVFEGIRVIAGRAFRLEQHLARLSLGARALAIELPMPLAEVRAVVEQTIGAYGADEAYVRLLLTRGVGPLGVDPTTCPKANLVCIVAPIKLFSEEQRERGLDLITSSYRRPSADVLDVRVKTLNYLGSVLPKLEARQRGADEALLLNQRGHIAEAAVANVFVYRQGKLATPPGSEGCLEGITRRAVMELAREQGYVVEEQVLGRHDLFAAEEAFLTGSGAGVIAIRSLDGRVIGSGKRGPVTHLLAQAQRALAEAEARR